jgi:hypothetical protein
MTTIQWEVSVLCVGIVAYFALSMVGARRFSFNINTIKGQAALSEVQAAALILGVLALAAGVSAWAIFYTSAVKGCESNERSIQAAAESYRAAVGSLPATAAAITVTAGTTAGTFANPTSTSVDYLGQLPIDPVNPTGSYSWTYTAGTASAPELYVILCPGLHTKADLSSLTGGSTETSGKIQWSSSGANVGFKAI